MFDLLQGFCIHQSLGTEHASAYIMLPCLLHKQLAPFTFCTSWTQTSRQAGKAIAQLHHCRKDMSGKCMSTVTDGMPTIVY